MLETLLRKFIGREVELPADNSLEAEVQRAALARDEIKRHPLSPEVLKLRDDERQKNRKLSSAELALTTDPVTARELQEKIDALDAEEARDLQHTARVKDICDDYDAAQAALTNRVDRDQAAAAKDAIAQLGERLAARETEIEAAYLKLTTLLGEQAVDTAAARGTHLWNTRSG